MHPCVLLRRAARSHAMPGAVRCGAGVRGGVHGCLCVGHLNKRKSSKVPCCFKFQDYHFRLVDAGGAGGTDETGTSTDTHQLPVMSMGTLIDVPAFLVLCLWDSVPNGSLT